MDVEVAERARGQSGDEMAQYLQLVRRWWWLLVVMTVLGAAVGYVVGQRIPKQYRAETTLIVAAGAPSPELEERLIPDQRSALVKTYRELLLKRPVLEAVIADLALETTPEKLAETMAVREVRDTQILVLSAQDSDPRRAAAIANGAVAAFNRQAPDLLANPFAAGRGELNVVEVAAPPAEPLGAGPLRNIVIGALIGMLLASGVVFAAEQFRTSVRSARDIAELTGLPTIVEIGHLEGRRPHERLVTIASPASRTAEVYRMLRLPLEGGAGQQPIRTLLITSAGVSDGKSLTAANLAVALAQTGLRTILVDANLRRPMVHQLFRQENARGLTTALHQRAIGRVSEHLVESGVENLRLLPSGPRPEHGFNLVRMLTPHHVLALIQDLDEQADVQIFDTPPVLEVIETALLARSCDAALLVVHAGRTTAEELLRAREALARSRVELLGVVLNRAERPVVGMLGGPPAGGPLLTVPETIPRPALSHPFGEAAPLVPARRDGSPGRVNLLGGDRERTVDR
jgi:capsular exopolysaccharide synthesis family protein